MIYALLMLACWVAWVRVGWGLPWGGVLRPKYYRRLRDRELRNWAVGAGYCLRHHAYAGGCADAAALTDPVTGEPIPMRWQAYALTNSRHGGRWESFDGSFVNPMVAADVPFVESPGPLGARRRPRRDH